MNTPPSSEPETGPTPSPEPQGPIVAVTISGDRVDAPGDRVTAKVGEPVTFSITSDRPGELHVHSSPEQTPGFEVGRRDVHVAVDRPGLVEENGRGSGRERVVQSVGNSGDDGPIKKK